MCIAYSVCIWPCGSVNELDRSRWLYQRELGKNKNKRIFVFVRSFVEVKINVRGERHLMSFFRAAQSC